MPGEFNGYQVFKADGLVQSPDQMYEIDVLTQENTLDLTGLVSGQNYSFAVAAKSNNLMGPLSNISYATTESGMETAIYLPMYCTCWTVQD